MHAVLSPRALRAVMVALTSLVGAVTPASAQAFISPYIGSNFGGDATCPKGVSACEERNVALGLAFGNLNALIGFEEDLSYGKGLLKAPGLAKSNVLTVMSNVVVGPLIGYVRPYAAGGFGLVRLTTTLAPSSLVELNDTNIGWNIGGGLMVSYGHIGVRGDIRFFHGFNDLDALDLPSGDMKLDYGRATIGIVLH